MKTGHKYTHYFGLRITCFSNCCDACVITGCHGLHCSVCFKEVGKRVGKLYYERK